MSDVLKKLLSKFMRNSKGLEIKPRKISAKHKFQVIVETSEGSIKDKIYATNSAARKRVAAIVNGDEYNEGFSYCRVEELFL